MMKQISRAVTISHSRVVKSSLRFFSTEEGPVLIGDYYTPESLSTKASTQTRARDMDEALRLARAFSNSGYDETIQINLNLGIDPRKPGQTVRGVARVPHASGKKSVVAVFAKGDKAVEARQAGADIVGDDDLINEIASGKIEFTRCIATPDMMRSLAKVSRILGPRGLMPNPKMGTVTMDVRAAVELTRQGNIEYRCDKTGIISVVVGKVSWPNDKLRENMDSFVKVISDARPAKAKGMYFRSAFVCTSKGLGIPVDTTKPPFR